MDYLPLIPWVFTSQPAVMGSAVASSDADVTLWIAAVGPANTNQTEVNILTTLVVAGKANGWWAKLDRLWIFATGTQAAALVDLAARASATLPVAPTFTAQLGFTGNGSTQYVSTGFNPSTAGGKYTQNDASYGVWVQTPGASAGTPVYIGNDSRGTPNNNFSRVNATQTAWAVNQGTGSTSTTLNPTSGVGLQHVERTAAAVSAIYHNGVSKGTSVGASAALTSQPIFVLASNNGTGSPAFFNGGVGSAAFIGSSMGATIAAAFYADLHTALTAINATNFP